MGRGGMSARQTRSAWRSAGAAGSAGASGRMAGEGWCGLGSGLASAVALEGCAAGSGGTSAFGLMGPGNVELLMRGLNMLILGPRSVDWVGLRWGGVPNSMDRWSFILSAL